MSRPLPRLTTPLVRDVLPSGQRGELRPASWDEAIERAAAGIRVAKEKHGPDSVGVFSCSKATNEMNYLAQKFIRVAVGSNNIDSCNRT
jgi:predicted molibdopterin-dependent oxidoreductase YjgC